MRVLGSAVLVMESFAVGFALLIVVLEVTIPYHRYSRVLRWLCLSLLAYIAVLFVAKVNWAEVAVSAFVPAIDFNKATFALLIALAGTTISPYLFFWQAAEEVEERHQAPEGFDLDGGVGDAREGVGVHAGAGVGEHVGRAGRVARRAQGDHEAHGRVALGGGLGELREHVVEERGEHGVELVQVVLEGAALWGNDPSRWFVELVLAGYRGEVREREIEDLDARGAAEVHPSVQGHRDVARRVRMLLHAG